MERELPVVSPSTPERADAARNRQKIIAAARELFEARGADGVSMDAVAAAAGVGKGTLYRRFGDRTGLAAVLFDDEERRLQDEILRGAPPLGPGPPPRERLHAFGAAHIGLLEKLGELYLAAERAAPGRRYRSPNHLSYRMHVMTLLGENRADDPQLGYLADCLLIPLTAEVYLHQRRVQELSVSEIEAGWCALADAVLGVG